MSDLAKRMSSIWENTNSRNAHLGEDGEQEEKLMGGWHGVDLDGTLVRYDGPSNGDIGEPVPRMVETVKGLLDSGEEVRIVTARVSSRVPVNFANQQRAAIQDLCMRLFGRVLEVTSEKDYAMIDLRDDRAIRVETNTGREL